MSFVNQRADRNAHEEEKEDLETSNPCDRSRGPIFKEEGFIIGLKDSIRLHADQHIYIFCIVENVPGSVPCSEVSDASRQ